MANSEHLEILHSRDKKWNKWREENLDIVPDLSGANLSNADLRMTDLSHANLSNADLGNAYLKGAYLGDANLFHANLYNADLSHTTLACTNLNSANIADANLFHANLYNADLKNAFMSGTNMTLANLDKVNLAGATAAYTVFGLTNLSTCKGLETVDVQYPCIIDFPTLRASKNIPKSFLIKIGLPELYIDCLPDFFHDDGIRFYPVFLSHSWENKDFARKLYEALIAKGVNVFFDEKKMKPGDNIFDSLSRGIELYDKTILVCSKDSLNSWWVGHELELVTEKERNLQKEIGEKIGLLIPITIDEHIYTWPGGKRMAIKNRNIGDFSKWQDEAEFEKALSDLIHALNVDRPEIKPPTYIKKK